MKKAIAIVVFATCSLVGMFVLGQTYEARERTATAVRVVGRPPHKDGFIETTSMYELDTVNSLFADRMEINFRTRLVAPNASNRVINTTWANFIENEYISSLEKKFLEIDGIRDVTFGQYQIELQRGSGFTWAEIKGPVMKLLDQEVPNFHKGTKGASGVFVSTSDTINQKPQDDCVEDHENKCVPLDPPYCRWTR